MGIDNFVFSTFIGLVAVAFVYVMTLCCLLFIGEAGFRKSVIYTVSFLLASFLIGNLIIHLIGIK
jgi:hypothetical protein